MPKRPQPNLQLFLDRLASRSVFTRREREAILALPGQPWIVSPDNDFVRLGDNVNHATLVLSGLVGRFDQTSTGARQITNLYIAGDMPDLHSVVQPTATSALQALSSATVLRIPHSALRAVATAYPGIAEAFWRDCVVDLMVHAQWVVNVGRRDAKTRIAHLLCEMACRYRAPAVDGRVSYQLPLTPAQIADATGLTPVHVNRSLEALREIGVNYRGSAVQISDWETLVQLADFDRTYLQLTDASPARFRLAEVA